MIQFFKDAELTRPAIEDAPKWFLFSESGGERTTSLWLGDAYYVTLMEDAEAGDTVLHLDQTVELPESGTLTAGAVQKTYSSKTATTVTIAALATPISAGTRFKAGTVYTTEGNLVIRSVGNSEVLVSLKAAGDTEYKIATAPYLFATPLNQASVQIDVKVSCQAGAEALFSDVRLEVRDIKSVAIGVANASVVGAFSVYRKNQGLQQQLRILAPGRELVEALPGFVFGDYRWRAKDEINAEPIVPTRWDLNTERTGVEKFGAGIGNGTDLKLTGLVKTGTSIYPIINGGHYFTGPKGYYLPADEVLEFFCATNQPTVMHDAEGNVTATHEPNLSPVLSAPVRQQTPVFVGRWRLDQSGYYDKATEYRYVGKRFSAESEFDPEDDGYQYTLDRTTKQIHLNKGLAPETLFLGVGTDDASVSFDMPVHPVDSVVNVYCDSYGVLGQLTRVQCPNFNFNKKTGTITVDQPTNEGQIWAGNPIFAEAVPAVAVQYDSASGKSRVVGSVDLNPAFAGVSKGHLYMMHRRWKPRSLQLFADKPRIPVPQSFTGVNDLVAFGPVYYERDYAMLLVTAYGSSEKDRVPNVRLRVQADAGFQGWINYLDPMTKDVEVVTGGDGSAGMVYLPTAGYGVYLDPTASVEGGDTLVLPVEVPYSQVFNALDGWLTKVYLVRNDDPYMGKVGAEITLGELPWAVAGTAGTQTYKTNGRRVLIRDDNNAPLIPTQVYDSLGRTPGQGGFSGVKRMTFGTALPTDSYIGSFFVSYVGRITLRLVSDEYGLESNSILLQLSAPEEIVEAVTADNTPANIAGYLLLDDDFNGIINKNRLAGGSMLDLNNFTNRV